MAKQRGMLFTTEMVKAILDGRKKQTRRIIDIDKHVEDEFIDEYDIRMGIGGCYEVVTGSNEWVADLECTQGKIGDQLYVRETWRIAGWRFDDGEVLVEYKDGTKLWMPMHDPTEDSMWLQNQIDKLEAKGVLKPESEDDEEDIRYSFTKPAPWKPCLHMPKCFSRIWLQIEDIRVERVQDISEEDAKDEGANKLMPVLSGWVTPNHPVYEEANAGYRDGFRYIWQKINGAESWETNPWTWAISFQVLSKEGKEGSNVFS